MRVPEGETKPLFRSHLSPAHFHPNAVCSPGFSPMKARIEKKNLQLIDPFGIARGTTTARDTVILELECGGRGEASTVSYRGQTIDGEIAALKAMTPLIPDEPWEIEEILGLLRDKFPDHTAALAAIDMAIHDWVGIRLGVPLYRLFGCSSPQAKRKQTSFTIGIDKKEVMLQKVAKAKEHPILKIKLGRNAEQDMDVMKAIRKAEPGKPLRVDANAGWTLDEARRCIRLLADLGIDYVEQPLAIGNFEQLAILSKESPLPIFVDEDVDSASDIPKLAGKCHGVNLKLVKTGGLLEARKLTAFARACDLQVMIGCMIESSLGITAGAHLGALIDHLDLDGHLLISNDPFQGMTLEGPDRIVHVPEDRPGIGAIERPSPAN